jgi:glutamate 5-kinase
MADFYKKLVIKIGSNVLAKENGLPDLERMALLIDEIAGLKKEGRQVIVVSSGAVATGRSLVKVSPRAAVHRCWLPKTISGTGFITAIC